MLVDYLFRDVSGKTKEDNFKMILFLFRIQNVSFGQDKDS